MEIEGVREFWNKNVFNWKVATNLEVGGSEFFKEVERYRFDKLGYLPKVVNYSAYSGKTVLDVGCGLATDLSRFATGGAHVTGIDISPSAIKLSRQNFSLRQLDGDFFEMDGEAMSFEKDSFDFIYCHTVLHFTPNPQKMLREIKRVLKPGGQALLMTINRSSWLYFLHRLVGLEIDYLDSPVFHKFNYRDFDEMTAIFEERKFLVERFPVRTEVHKGLKAFVYNTCFVDAYNALPKVIIGKTGYHLLAFVKKRFEFVNVDAARY